MANEITIPALITAIETYNKSLLSRDFVSFRKALSAYEQIRDQLIDAGHVIEFTHVPVANPIQPIRSTHVSVKWVIESVMIDGQTHLIPR